MDDARPLPARFQESIKNAIETNKLNEAQMDALATLDLTPTAYLEGKLRDKERREKTLFFSQCGIAEIYVEEHNQEVCVMTTDGNIYFHELHYI